ncbi:unnamed protein product [Urochloa decumbens]|uniref:Uncharacterized protein n=1 Tax=Urochloa decumbens TaxID=240449 RepID=A0ABC8YY01_9POAL
MPPSTAPPASAAARARTVRIFVDGSGRRVLFAEAGADAAAFLSSLLAAPVRAAAAEMLREDPESSAAACCSFGNLAAASDALLPRVHAASSSRAPAGMGIMARRLFRCGHLGCPCSDVASREPGSACPCASRSCRAAATGGTGTRDTELHFLEACFYRRPDGSASGRSRGGGRRSGDTFYRCRARDERRGGAGRDVFPCRFRVTDERGVECPLCGGRTTVEVKCAAKAGGEEERSSVASEAPDAGHGGGEDAQDGGPATRYAIMDDLSVRSVAAGLSGAALLSALGVAADPEDVREETVPFGYKEGFSLLWAALRSKTALTDVFLPAVTPAARRRRR